MGNLRQEAVARGVEPERLVFANSLPSTEEHLARQRLADLFLDTLPYNAHATAINALWVGLPVLTCRGSTFAGRVGASLLEALGLPELITESLEEYEQRALELARDPRRLAAIRAKLARQKLSTPLFDTAGFCRHLESAYQQMYERHRRGEPPEHFAVSA
jgi:predicted O-linked N-acetylglucosamine transferase (SPINDLY family)